MNFSLLDLELMDFAEEETLFQTNVSGENELMVFEMDDPEEMLKPAFINPFFLYILIIYSISFVVGIIGNVFVIVGDRKSRNVTNLFLLR